MGLSEQVKADIKESLKAGDNFRTGVLRLLDSAFQTLAIAKRGEEQTVTEDDLVKVVAKEAKKRREAASLYEQGGRSDLADKEKEELEIISAYLPAAPTKEEITKIIDEVLASGVTEFGSAMKAVMSKLSGSVSGGEVSAIIKEKLSS